MYLDKSPEYWAGWALANLKRIRTFAGVSQSELAKMSGVPVRQIQLFEQRQGDINHTKAINVLKLARSLGCKSEELLEI